MSTTVLIASVVAILFSGLVSTHGNNPSNGANLAAKKRLGERITNTQIINTGHQSQSQPPKRPGNGAYNSKNGTVAEEDKSCVTKDNQPGECVPYYLCSANNTILTNGLGIIDIRNKDGSCKSNLEVCCSLSVQLEKPIERPPINTSKTTGCGYRNPDGVSMTRNSYQDGNARFGEFNWVVAIFGINPRENFDWSLLCGGSLIHPQIALTAAHCVHSHSKLQSASNLTVRAGEWNLWSEDEMLPHQDRKVIKIIKHPDYVDGVLVYDAALLFFDSPLEMAENVGTVCLPEIDEQIEPSIRCITSGWGRDVSGKIASNKNILKKVDLPIVRNSKCQRKLRETRLGTRFILDNSFICAGGEPDKDACLGDGGSPLVCPIQNANERYIQMGIVAWGIGCSQKHIPGVYGNVPLFRQWIDETVVREGYTPDSYQL